MKKKFQSSFAWRFAALISAAALLVAALFLVASRGTLTTAYLRGDLRVENTAEFFSTTLLLIGALTAVVMALVGMIVFIVLSHRIAGPIHRLQAALGEIRRGNLTYRFQLRRKDEFGELAEDLNLVSRELDAKIAELKREVARARGAASADAALSAAALKRAAEIADSFKTSD